MKVKLDIDEKYTDFEIIIRSNKLTDELKEIISSIKGYKTIVAKKDNRNYPININDILYVDTIDEKTFVYLNNNIYEVNKRLYELESELSDNFVRISKNTILNINKLNSVKALINGKYEAFLINDEKLIISRHYVAGFKKKFGL